MAPDGYIVPAREGVKHYYGDTVRVLFVSSAVLLIVAETTGADLPLSMVGAVAWAVILVVAAGITNPAQGWIHYANEAIAVVGTIVFATSAIGHWREGAGIFDSTYLFVEIIALFSLISLYFTTKTIRGALLRPHLS